MRSSWSWGPCGPFRSPVPTIWPFGWGRSSEGPWSFLWCFCTWWLLWWYENSMRSCSSTWRPLETEVDLEKQVWGSLKYLRHTTCSKCSKEVWILFFGDYYSGIITVLTKKCLLGNILYSLFGSFFPFLSHTFLLNTSLIISTNFLATYRKKMPPNRNVWRMLGNKPWRQ